MKARQAIEIETATSCFRDDFRALQAFEISMLLIVYLSVTSTLMMQQFSSMSKFILLSKKQTAKMNFSALEIRKMISRRD